MVTLYDITLVIEVILLLTLTLGSYYGRKLNMNLHHKLIYGTVLTQLLIFIFVMAPAVGFWSNNGGITVILAFHMIMGIITMIGSLVLCVVFLARSNDYDLPTLRWTKPLMIFTFISWIITFLLGFIFYLDTYIFS